MEFLSFIILGTVIGILSGFFGIGGGIILTPLLLILGYPVSTAIVLSLILTLGSTITGIFSHIRLKNVHLRDSLAVGLSGVLGSIFITPFCFLARKKCWSR